MSGCPPVLTAAAAAAAATCPQAASSVLKAERRVVMDLDASSLHYLFSAYLDGPDIAACAQVRACACMSSSWLVCSMRHACRCTAANSQCFLLHTDLPPLPQPRSPGVPCLANRGSFGGAVEGQGCGTGATPAPAPRRPAARCGCLDLMLGLAVRWDMKAVHCDTKAVRLGQDLGLTEAQPHLR